MKIDKTTQICVTLVVLVLWFVFPLTAIEPGADKPICIGGDTIHNVADTLLTVADGFDANYTQIRTWRGTFLLTEFTGRTSAERTEMTDLSEQDIESPEDSLAKVRRQFRGEFECDFKGLRLFTAKRVVEESTISLNDGTNHPTGRDKYSASPNI